MKLLEKILNGIDEIGAFADLLPSLAQFGNDKKLYDYQREALYNCLKLLYVYYGDHCDGGDHAEGKGTAGNRKRLMELYDRAYPGFAWENRLKKYANEKKRIWNEKFLFFTSNGYFTPRFDREEEYIDASDFYNRCAFWMATGSGKSVVIVKLIDLLQKLMKAGLIPEKPIMLLTPKEYIIRQIMEEAEAFNSFPGNRDGISFRSLKEYENYEKTADSDTEDVFVYRSDLLRENTTDHILSHYDIDNGGNWYLILDEAHRGDNDDSLAKGYFTALTRRGFLFNFSATFADTIDIQTTLYNFNLEKFIERGYGKNILVGRMLYTFRKGRTEPDELEKQKEVIKSFLIYTAVKRSRGGMDMYHSPLLMTLVGTVNTENADLNIYFHIIEQIATGKIKRSLFAKAKKELLEQEICGETIRYSLGREELDVAGKRYGGKSLVELIMELSPRHILKELFNASSYGRIELLHSGDMQEIGMKLETSDKMFGLIKIGERDRFEKSIMSDEKNYLVTKSLSADCFFDRLETDPHINMLCGSRAFYEGWDTNRPNVVNLIDIGSRNAQKLAPQAIGRGIRIRPDAGRRKRLAWDDPGKNQLLETLFVFATDRDVLAAIVDMGGMDGNGEKDAPGIGKASGAAETAMNEAVGTVKNGNIHMMQERQGTSGTDRKKRKLKKYGISKRSYDNFRAFLASFPCEVLFINYGLRFEDYRFLMEGLPEDISKSPLFEESEDEYTDMIWLLKKMIGGEYGQPDFVRAGKGYALGDG